MKKHILTIAAASAVLLLTACSGMEAKDTPAADTKQSTTTETTETTEAAPAPDNPKVFKFGATGTYDDGVKLTVSKPAAFTPGQYAAGNDQNSALKFTITVVNGSTKTIQNPVYYAELTSGGKSASGIFDEAITNPPSTPLLPKQKVSFPVAFSVADKTDLTMQLTVDYDLHSAATFSTDAS